MALKSPEHTLVVPPKEILSVLHPALLNHNMPKTSILDRDGNLLPINEDDLQRPSRPEVVNHYANMYTAALVSEAKKTVIDFELFMELQRRATQRFLKDNSIHSWNRGGEKRFRQNANTRLVREYDRKCGIFQRGGKSYLTSI